MKDWTVYIIQCSDGSLYTGISIDVAKRYQQHLSRQGAKYFRAREPEKLVYQEPEHNRSSASKREYAIKQLSRKEKLILIDSELNQLLQAQTRSSQDE